MNTRPSRTLQLKSRPPTGWMARLTPWLLAILLAITPLTLTGGRAMAAPPPVEVTLEPRQIAVGETAQLTITSTGSGMDGITLPVVSGLEFRVVGQSRRLEIINGATLSTTSVILRVTPQSAGIFTIPGLTPQSQPLVLRVNPDNGAGSGSPYGNPYASGRPPVATNNSSPSGIHMSADGAAFVRMNLPKRDVYVGESIPVDIEVGMKAGFVTSVNGLPTLTGNDFTLNNLSRKPERVEKLIDGKPFTVLTWHSVLAPVKPGTFNLSVETPLTIRVRTRPARDSSIDDLLGDPFLQNFFGATVPKDITAASAPAELKVLPLPTDGRPADFSGAVGSFKIASDLSSTRAAVGDPLTLRLHVTGTGNFDRVDTPMLEHLEHWKTYPPKSTFTPSDAIGYKGEKLFEQPLIASQPGTQSLPDVAFSYFDPSTRRYETVHSTPPGVTISPALADAEPPTTAAGATSATPPDAAHARAPSSPPGLRPDHAAAAAGHVAVSLVPLYLRPAFLVLPSLLALAFAGGWLSLRLRAHAPGRPGSRSSLGSRGTLSDTLLAMATLGRLGPRGRRPPQFSKTASRLLAQMESAARSGDSVTFFTTARKALQQSLAARWQVTPDDLTPDIVQARLSPAGPEGPDGIGGIGGNDHQDSEDTENLRQIIALADEANYAGQGMTTTDFERWIHIVRRQLQDPPPGPPNATPREAPRAARSDTRPHTPPGTPGTPPGAPTFRNDART